MLFRSATTGRDVTTNVHKVGVSGDDMSNLQVKSQQNISDSRNEILPAEDVITATTGRDVTTNVHKVGVSGDDMSNS